MGDIFAILERYNIKVNLVQTSAVNMSLSIDKTRRLSEVIEALEAKEFFVKYNDGMELLTIRGYTVPYLEKYSRNDDSIYLAQRTRKIVRIVRRETV